MAHQLGVNVSLGLAFLLVPLASYGDESPSVLLERAFQEEIPNARNPAALQGRYARFLWQEKKWEKAAAAFEELSELNPDEAEEIGKLKELIGRQVAVDSKEAEQALITLRDKRVAKLDSDGTFAQLEQRKQSMQKTLQKLGIDHDKRAAEKQAKLAELSKQYDFKNSDWNRSLRTEEAEYKQLSSIVWELNSLNRTDDALTVVKQLFERYQDIPEAHLVYAKTLGKARNYSEAAKVLTAASTQFPKNASAKVFRDAYQKASKKSPGVETALAGLEILDLEELIAAYRGTIKLSSPEEHQ